MCTKWKRFTFGAIMLTSLLLFLFGCSGGGGSSKAPSKSIRGIVSDPATGQRLSNITLTAYAIRADGTRATTPLSTPVSIRSDGQGNYTLHIPLNYTGGVMVVATLPGGRQIRAVIPSVSGGQTVVTNVMVSLATEMVVEYIIQNMEGIFTPANIQQAILVLEPFFGQNFTQAPPPATGAPLTQPQPPDRRFPEQDLLVMTQAINSLLGSTTIAALVTVNPATGIITLGTVSNLTNLNLAIDTVVDDLIDTGMLPGSYTPLPIVPIPEPALTDTTPPSAPANLTAIATSSSVALSWDAATDNVGVTAYYVYRNGLFIAVVSTPTLTITDTNLTANTEYTYEVKARDALGNVSTGSTINVTTNPATTILTYTISGKITMNGAVLPGIPVTLSGFGSGVAITDANGVYLFTGVLEGSYTITPSRTGYAFSPVSIGVSVTTANLTGKDFIASLTGAVIGDITYPNGTVIGGVTYPPGTVIGGITFPYGVVIGGVIYPTGTVIGGFTYPPGTIIGGITYPTGTVIGGITYPTATVIGGVTYPTGTVIGGITYPNGVVIGGVTYPSGTVVGGVAFPVGAITTGVTYPSGTVIGGVTYPSGTVTGGVIYPGGTVIGEVTYPTGTVIGGVTYPSGTVIGGITLPTSTVIGGITYPAGTIISGVTYPQGTITGGITYPNGIVIGGVTYPTSTVIGGITYPTGSVIGGITYPNGVVIGGVTYPAGTVVGGIAFPAGAVTTGFTFPNGAVIGGITYPPGTIIGGITYPSVSVIGGVTYPTATVISGVTYPTGSVISGVTYQNGVVIGGITYPPGTVVGGIAFPVGAVASGVLFPGASVNISSFNWIP